MSQKVRIVEVGARDGLQNEKRIIATADKITLIDYLSQSGLQHIEATSFVSPKWIPQLADATEVMLGITRRMGVIYSALTPNVQGYERAMACQVNEVAVFASASETFSQKNINCSIATSLARFSELMRLAQRDGIAVRGYVSCVTDCPYEGRIKPETVVTVSKQLLDAGCYEISLGDTIGKATPETLRALLEAMLPVIPSSQLAGHYHDTSGNALANVEVSLAYGLRTFDSAVAGLGGCPYAPGAKGNIATGEVLALLTQLGYETGVDKQKLGLAEDFARQLLHQPYN